MKINDLKFTAYGLMFMGGFILFLAIFFCWIDRRDGLQENIELNLPTLALTCMILGGIVDKIEKRLSDIEGRLQKNQPPSA